MVKRKINYLLLCILLILSCLLTCVNTTLTAFASSISVDNSFSNVLEDLESDENFVVEEYPVNMTDYSLQIINVAESIDKELFIYVYQPCSPNNRLKATSINMSLQDAGLGDVDYNLYTLTLLNSNGVFVKYKVDNFVVSADTIRFYNIASIHSKWYDEYYGEDWFISW